MISLCWHVITKFAICWFRNNLSLWKRGNMLGPNNHCESCLADMFLLRRYTSLWTDADHRGRPIRGGTGWRHPRVTRSAVSHQPWLPDLSYLSGDVLAPAPPSLSPHVLPCVPPAMHTRGGSRRRQHRVSDLPGSRTHPGRRRRRLQSELLREQPTGGDAVERAASVRELQRESSRRRTLPRLSRLPVRRVSRCTQAN